MRFTVYLAAAAATLAVATPAVAQQASANALAKGVVVQPLTLAKARTWISAPSSAAPSPVTWSSTPTQAAASSAAA